MYIDTHTHDTMLQGICNYWGILPETLSKFFHETAKKCTQGIYCDGNILDKEIDLFIHANSSPSPIDEILFFHLGRRLNGADDTIGNNLHELLTTETPISSFLKEHNIQFVENTGHLEILENGVPVSLENTYKAGVCYLRSRLGYNVGRED